MYMTNGGVFGGGGGPQTLWYFGYFLKNVNIFVQTIDRGI